MKKIYEAPEMDVVMFDTEDVITTSGEQIVVTGENELPFTPAG